MDKYIVSARKYRPMSFDSVVGQHALTTTLRNAIAQGKLAHAYLFCGPRGVGKTTCARIFAKTINCLTPTPTGDACNECESCRAFNEGRSYNILELDAASNNSVEDIRTLIEQVQIPPQVGHYKVFIIDEVHMLSTAAFNAFLKTLEEPPAHAIFILATTEKHKILPTILSRCQIYDFARITVNDTVDHLQYVAEKEGIQYERDALHVIAEKADGGMRDALSIFDQVASFCEGNITYQKVIEDLNVLDYDQYFAMTDDLLNRNIPSAMVRLNDILNKGFEANYFIGGQASHFRNLLMCRDEQTLPLLDVSDEVRQRYREQALRCQPKFLYRALKLCNDCDINYRASRNKRLLVELTLIQVAQAVDGDDGAGCGLRPIRRLKPLFTQTAVNTTASAVNHSAAVANAAKATASANTVAQTAQTSAPAASDVKASNIISTLSNAQKPRTHVAQTLSIRKIRSQYQSASSDESTPTPTVKENSPTPTAATQRKATPFNQDRLEYYWYRFAQQLPIEKSALAGRMKNMHPYIGEGWAVSVEVENEMVEQYMHEIQIALMNYLRINLLNDDITLKIQLAANNSEVRTMNRLEQFKDVLSRNPILEKLRKQLDLELA